MDDAEQNIRTHSKILEANTWRRRPFTLVIAAVLIVLFFVASSAWYLLALGAPSSDFPVGMAFEIEEGSTTSETLAHLESARLIRSATYLKFLLWSEYKDAYIRAGRYIFDHPLSASEIAHAITSGEYARPSVSLTFYEGVRGKDIVNILHDALPDSAQTFDPKAFDEHIGYLFPDTYYVSKDITEDALITLMEVTFNKKTTDLETEVKKSNLNLNKDDVITLASIVEREANTDESMGIIAGILEKRLKLGMPLQVDATFDYILGKQSRDLTDEDLTIDSPYNTYTHTGLPPTPIANPGLKAIEAVLHPTQTDYLYYVTGSDGTFHYAKTFEEHKRNKELYL